MEPVAVALLLLAVVAFVALPLRRPPTTYGGEALDARLADLEARKEVKYREIRDAEADHAQGKLSGEDFRALNAELRREALEILAEIERLRTS